MSRLPEFEQLQRTKDGRKLAFARLTCGRCAGHHEFGANGLFKGAPPEFVRQHAQAAGWWPKGREWLCPSCIKARRGNGHDSAADERQIASPEPAPAPAAKQKRKRAFNGRTTGRRLHQLLDTAMSMVARGVKVPDAAAATGISTNVIYKARRERPAANDGGTMQGNGTSALVPIRALNPKETRGVMSALEEHFDEAAGRYSAGWSDDRVARDCDVPRANVAKLRDDAFGPLRFNPMIDEALSMVSRLETELAGLRESVAGLQAKAARIEEGLAAALKRLSDAGA